MGYPQKQLQVKPSVAQRKLLIGDMKNEIAEGHILKNDSAEKPLHKKTGVDSGRLFFFTLLFSYCVVSSTDRPNRLTCSVVLSVKLH